MKSSYEVHVLRLVLGALYVSTCLACHLLLWPGLGFQDMDVDCGARLSCSGVSVSCDGSPPAEPREVLAAQGTGCPQALACPTAGWGTPAYVHAVETHRGERRGKWWEKAHSLVMVQPLLLARQGKPQPSVAAPRSHHAMPSHRKERLARC